MTQYFHGSIDGDAPDDMDREDIRDALNEALPSWATAYVRDVK